MSADSFPTNNPEFDAARAVALATLTSDPSIYTTIDYWAAGSQGHGLKLQNGPKPEDPFIKWNAVGEYDWQKACEAAAPFSAKTWHKGEGVVGKITTPELRAYVLYFQMVGDSARPDVMSYTVVPSTSEFEGVIEVVEKDPRILLDAFKGIAPDDAKDFTEGVRLVSDSVIDLQQHTRKHMPVDGLNKTAGERVAKPPVPQTPLPAAKRVGRFVRRLGGGF